MKSVALTSIALIFALISTPVHADVQYTVTDLGSFAGGLSNATAINSLGQVAGHSYTTSLGRWHAFLYSDGTMSDLGTLGHVYSNAYGINVSGQVVGQVADSAGFGIAFLYSRIDDRNRHSRRPIQWSVRHQ